MSSLGHWYSDVPKTSLYVPRVSAIVQTSLLRHTVDGTLLLSFPEFETWWRCFSVSVWYWHLCCTSMCWDVKTFWSRPLLILSFFLSNNSLQTIKVQYRWILKDLSQDGACTDFDEILDVNSSKGGLMINITFDPLKNCWT